MAAAAPKKALFKRFVELGRVVLISYGPDAGKLATVLDFVNQTSVLIDGPASLTGVTRQVINVKWLSLTDLRVKVALNARQKSLIKAWTDADVLNKWQSSAWAKKIAAKKEKANSSDFTRFTVKLKKQAVMKKAKASIKA